ncbi:haloacid dehalogenase [Hypericibacter terrae]|uniref:Haloacid dehalogenase n=1 Tax=Hypericibacter terrae TaxID=2602015 RepID=A0A5J6MH65_9PROT|nr:HAD family hydrolase [Hypericibacter terrae]QEX16813.1 haloacid dehalogenase [Hypericibacter terrae]
MSDKQSPSELSRRQALTLPLAAAAVGLLAPSLAKAAADDPLPSWNDSRSKTAILDFVGRVTKEGGSDFVPVEDRIAVFDNDGTLWSEQPAYFQFFFALARVKQLYPEHPEWENQQPFAAAISGDMKTLAESGEKGMATIVMATHAGMTTAEFAQLVVDWATTAKHPRFNRLFIDLVYQPMLDTLALLRQNGFKTYIVSGGGIEFMRPWTEKVYGIPPEQVVGSSIVTKFEMKDGKPVLMRLPKIDFIDDGPGKPVGINQFIGRRPIFAAGNSDGDLEMLQWVTGGQGPRFGMLVHHTDEKREWAYDRQSKVGRLDKALDAAVAAKWTVVDMKWDWAKIYPFGG